MSNLYVSIIVPVYNVEQYLEKCLESILKQGFTEEQYEVIMVNDGSSDRSEAICKEYSEKYLNFHLLNQKNSGVSIARNNGIEHAKGRYIVFVDADDYLLDKGLYLACSQYFEREDIDMIHYHSSYDHWEIKPIDNAEDFNGTGHEYIIKIGLPSFCWLFFYKKDFLNKHHLRFKPYIVGEDQLFSSAAIIANPRLVSTKANFYRYVIRGESATTKRSIEHTQKCVDHYLNAYKDIMDTMSKYGIQKGERVYDCCIDSVNSKKMFGLSRMLSAEYSRADYKKVMHKCEEINFYPVLRISQEQNLKWKTKLMNAIMQYYFVYYITSFAFNKIIVPYIMPRIRKKL